MLKVHRVGEEQGLALSLQWRTLDKRKNPAIGSRAATTPCLFDMGYTLVHFEPEQRVVVQEALRSIGIERSTEEIRAAVDQVFTGYYRDAATATFPATAELRSRNPGPPGGSHPGAAGRGCRYAIPGWFRRGHSLGVQPSRSHPPLPRDDRRAGDAARPGLPHGDCLQLELEPAQRVAQVELDRFFEVIWASAYAGCNKPHPGIFRQALDQMKVLSRARPVCGRQLLARRRRRPKAPGWMPSCWTATEWRTPTARSFAICGGSWICWVSNRALPRPVAWAA